MYNSTINVIVMVQHLEIQFKNELVWSFVFFVVDDFVGFIHFSVVEHTEDILSRSINVTAQEEIGKAEQVVVFVQDVPTIL